MFQLLGTVFRHATMSRQTPVSVEALVPRSGVFAVLNSRIYVRLARARLVRRFHCLHL